MMCSDQLLEEKVKEFCTRNKKDEGDMWQVINHIHTKEYGRNIIWEKQEEEKKNNIGDIPMSQYFAKIQMVHNAIHIIQGLENCIQKGWDLR